MTNQENFLLKNARFSRTLFSSTRCPNQQNTFLLKIAFFASFFILDSTVSFKKWSIRQFIFSNSRELTKPGLLNPVHFPGSLRCGKIRSMQGQMALQRALKNSLKGNKEAVGRGELYLIAIMTAAATY